MATQQADPESFLPIPPASFHILIVLAKGENHGYRIMQEIDEATEGSFRIGPGTLYTSIKRMLKAGWIEEVDQRADPSLNDERRRYYRLTGLGQRVSQAEALRLAKVVNLAHDANMLSGFTWSPAGEGGT
jgi:DNA-binding PadR family transcriptional regulator